MVDESKPFELINSKTVYDNGWINVREDRVIRPSGDEGLFGVVSMKEGSTVLPIRADGNVYLVREYKYGIDRISIEVMSGGLDSNETPLNAAQRELMEELGLSAESFTYLGFVDPFTTVVSSRNHMYLAENLHSGKAQDNPDEIVQAMCVPFDKALDMVMSGKITHSASCVTILKADRVLRAR